METLDIAVLSALVLALILFYTKGKLWDKENSNESINGAVNSSDLVETLKQSGKKAVVFYGSQTGTAEDYAHKFAKEFQAKFFIPTMTCDLADYSYDNLTEISEIIADFKLAVFFMSTYGEGEPTDNAVEFFDYLENECDSLDFKFGCFGLGNCTYEFYNAIGTKTVELLQEKGATLIGELGLGDDGKATMDEDYLAWKESFMDVIKSNLDLDEHEVKYEPALQVTESDLSIDDLSVSLGEPNSKYINPKSEQQLNALRLGPFDHAHPYLAPVISSKELFNSESRHCIHAEFDLSDSNLKYSTGDHIAIWPSNSNEKVFTLLKVLNLSESKDKVVTLKSLDSTLALPFPSPTTYDSILRHYLEISGPVSRQFLKSVVQFAPTEEIKAKANAIADDKDLFHKEVTEKYLNIADMLHFLSSGAPWATIPFSFIIESVAKLQPRYYSISSSSSCEKQTVHVTAVVEQENPETSDHVVTGVTTNLLLNIHAKQNKKSIELIQNYDLEGPRSKFSPFKLPVHIRRSTFKLPSNPATPIIMVGPGTGVAPFRGFIREKTKQVLNSKVGDMLLFFGCRRSDEDFLYKEEWPEYSKKLGTSLNMITAFSREGKEKVYVQHKMKEYKNKIAELMDQGAFFYVCGDAGRMARDVQNELISILKESKKVTEEIASDMVKAMKVSNRYQEDVW